MPEELLVAKLQIAVFAVIVIGIAYICLRAITSDDWPGVDIARAKERLKITGPPIIHPKRCKSCKGIVFYREVKPGKHKCTECREKE